MYVLYSYVYTGNGNVVLFSNTLNVYPFSVHCKGNYFSAKQASTLDIELDNGCQDDEYMHTLSLYIPRCDSEL